MHPGGGSQRTPALVVTAGLGLALASLPLAAVSGPPYLALSSVNVWMVGFELGLFAAVVALPFLLERRLRPRLADRDARWERALLQWGAIALALAAVALGVGAAAGFGGGSLAGAVAVVAAVEAAIVLAVLATWMLAG